MGKYQIIISEDYTTGIYNSGLTVSVNRSADKYKIEYGYVKWHGNTGGYATRRYYVAGKDGRKMLKSYQLEVRNPSSNPLDVWMA